MRAKHLLAASVILAALASAATLAQPSPSTSTREQTTAATRTIDPVIEELDFPGGTVESYVKVLRQAAGDQPVNIVYPTQAATLDVPAITLREVDVFTALRSVSHEATQAITRLENGRSFSWSVNKIQGDATPVYTIFVRETSPPHLRPGYEIRQPPRSTVVHAITELITGHSAMSADDVLSAIQAALAMEVGQEGIDEVKLAYHEGSGLVFAHITNSQGRLIESTILNLHVSRAAKQRGQEQTAVVALMRRLNVSSPDEAAAKLAHFEQLRQENLQLKEQIGKLSEQIVALRAASSQPPR